MPARRETWRHRLITLLATILTFLDSLAMVPMVGTRFVAPADDGRIAITVEMPIGSSLDYTTARLEKLEVALTEFPEVQSVYTTVNVGQSPGKNRVNVIVQLIPAADRDRRPVDLGVPIRESDR